MPRSPGLSGSGSPAAAPASQKRPPRSPPRPARGYSPRTRRGGAESQTGSQRTRTHRRSRQSNGCA
eukprot:7642668-Alexandrium_andersonii.AAC.1